MFEVGTLLCLQSLPYLIPFLFLNLSQVFLLQQTKQCKNYCCGKSWPAWLAHSVVSLAELYRRPLLWVMVPLLWVFIHKIRRTHMEAHKEFQCASTRPSLNLFRRLMDSMRLQLLFPKQSDVRFKENLTSFYLTSVVRLV